jgi:co-chaperonin GroES (HSP10)
MPKKTPPSIKLVGDRIAVEFLPEDRKEGNLYLPDDHVITNRRAKVMFVGTNMKESINVGDIVLVTIYDSSPKFKFNETELRLYPSDKILAVLS